MLRLALLGLVIGANNFAASLALGSLGQKHRRWRIVPIFGAVEFIVPLIGLSLGQRIAGAILENAAWLPPAILVGLGGWIIAGAIREELPGRDWAERVATLPGTTLLALGLGVDNLLVGFSFGLRGESTLALPLTIGVASMLFSLVGLSIGDRLQRHWERRAEVTAGFAMIAIGAASWAGLI